MPVKKTPKGLGKKKKSPSKKGLNPKTMAPKAPALANLNSAPPTDKVVIKKENYILLTDYVCSMSAHQNTEEPGVWHFALELFTDDQKLVDIHSQHTYKTFQDAIFDCYGIVEYMGFGIVDPNNKAQIVVSFWDNELKKYKDQVVYFDGLDFYRNNTVAATG